MLLLEPVIVQKHLLLPYTHRHICIHRSHKLLRFKMWCCTIHQRKYVCRIRTGCCWPWWLSEEVYCIQMWTQHHLTL